MRKLWRIGVLYEKKIVCRLYLQVCIYIIGFAVYAPNKNCLATLKERTKKSFDTILAFFVRNMLFSSNQCRMHFEKIVCKIPKIFTWSFLLMHAFAFGNYYFLTVIGAACYMCEQGRRNRGWRGAQFCYWYRNKPVSTKYFVLLSVPLNFQTFRRHWLGFAALAAVAKALNTDCPVKICDFYIYILFKQWFKYLPT